jgi:hypothetical protein
VVEPSSTEVVLPNRVEDEFDVLGSIEDEINSMWS